LWDFRTVEAPYLRATMRATQLRTSEFATPFSG
jgi:hypothetical protein